MLELRSAVTECQQGEACDEIRVAFHPTIVVVDPVSIRMLPLCDARTAI
jgi:hypothetical protein